MALLCKARVLVMAVPLARWRGSIGLPAAAAPAGPDKDAAQVRGLAARVERAAWRLPFECKCLVRAMALSWMLRERGLAHCVVIAVRPPDRRGEDDALHAWVEISGEIVLGELPGPWHEVYRTER